MRFAHIAKQGEHFLYDAKNQSEARVLLRYLGDRTLFVSLEYPSKAIEFPEDPLAWIGGADPRESQERVAWLEGPHKCLILTVFEMGRLRNKT